MNMKIVCSIFILLQIGLLSKVKTQGLRVGDLMPARMFKNVLNVRGNTLDITKEVPLTIIDFWETSCSGCVKSFAKIDSMRKKYAGKVQFIIVNSQSMDSTIKFFKRRSKLNYPLLPFVTADTTLKKLFPHKGVPFCVWLDVNLRVLGFSGGGMVNEKYINQALVGNNLIPAIKKSGHDKIPALLNYEYEGQIRYYSMITSCIIGNMDGPSQSFRDKMTGLSIEGTLETLYKRAYFNERPEYLAEPMILFLSKDSLLSKIPDPYDEDWFNKNCYYYTLRLPKQMDYQKWNFMKEDLLRFFGHKVVFRKFSMKCLVLDTNKYGQNCISKGGKFKNTFRRTSTDGDVKDSMREIQNGDFILVLNNLRLGFKETMPGLLFVNNTGINENAKVDIKLSGVALESMNLDLINIELATYNLKIIERIMEIEKVVVVDN